MSTLQRTNGEGTTWMRSEHGISLHFISSVVHFVYNNFPKKSIFSAQKSPQKPFFREKIKKSLPKTQGRPPPGLGRRADLPTGADRAIQKPGAALLPPMAHPACPSVLGLLMMMSAQFKWPVWIFYNKFWCRRDGYRIYASV